ncbi:hypothetical protein BH20ACI2_BH20ACI2_26150 [soil metagenome]
MQGVTDKIANKVKYMPREQQEQVLAYVESLIPPRRTMLEVVKEIRETIPEEVLKKLPVDGADNHDHYLYGAPKK